MGVDLDDVCCWGGLGVWRWGIDVVGYVVRCWVDCICGFGGCVCVGVCVLIWIIF